MRVVDELERRHKGILNDKLVDPALRIEAPPPHIVQKNRSILPNRGNASVLRFVRFLFDLRENFVPKSGPSLALHRGDPRCYSLPKPNNKELPCLSILRPCGALPISRASK